MGNKRRDEKNRTENKRKRKKERREQVENTLQIFITPVVA